MTQEDGTAIQADENLWDKARRIFRPEENRPATDRIEMMASGYLRDMDRLEMAPALLIHFVVRRQWCPMPVRLSTMTRRRYLDGGMKNPLEGGGSEYEIHIAVITRERETERIAGALESGSSAVTPWDVGRVLADADREGRGQHVLLARAGSELEGIYGPDVVMEAMRKLIHRKNQHQERLGDPEHRTRIIIGRRRRTIRRTR